MHCIAQATPWPMACQTLGAIAAAMLLHIVAGPGPLVLAPCTMMQAHVTSHRHYVPGPVTHLLLLLARVPISGTKGLLVVMLLPCFCKVLATAPSVHGATPCWHMALVLLLLAPGTMCHGLVIGTLGTYT